MYYLILKTQQYIEELNLLFFLVYYYPIFYNIFCIYSILIRDHIVINPITLYLL